MIRCKRAVDHDGGTDANDLAESIRRNIPFLVSNLLYVIIPYADYGCYTFVRALNEHFKKVKNVRLRRYGKRFCFQSRKPVTETVRIVRRKRNDGGVREEKSVFPSVPKRQTLGSNSRTLSSPHGKSVKLKKNPIGISDEPQRLSFGVPDADKKDTAHQ